MSRRWLCALLVGLLTTVSARAADDPLINLELPGPILCLDEAEGEGGVAVGLGVDVRHAETVAAKRRLRWWTPRRRAASWSR